MARAQAHDPRVKGSRARPLRAAWTVLAAVVLVAVLTACGPSAGNHAERQSAANLSSMIDQLHDDLAVTEIEGDTLASARRALSNHSDQLAALVAYDDFGSCRTMLRNAGSTDGHLQPVGVTLDSACGLLERAATLFTAAQANADPETLLRATARALKAAPLLYRAKLQLEMARGADQQP